MNKAKTMKMVLFVFISVSILILSSPLYLNKGNTVDVQAEIRNELSKDEKYGYQLVLLYDALDVLKGDIKDDTFARNFTYYSSDNIINTSTYENYLNTNIKILEKYKILSPKNSEKSRAYDNIVEILKTRLQDVLKLKEVKVVISSTDDSNNIEDNPIPYANPSNEGVGF